MNEPTTDPAHEPTHDPVSPPEETAPPRDAPRPDGPPPGALVDWETHRAFVREMHERHQRVYSLGGASAMGVSAGVIGIAAWAGVLATLLPWVTAIMVFLTGMLITRQRVRHSARTLLRQIQAYADANALDPESLRAHYREEGTYSFFQDIFEQSARASTS